MSNIIIQVVILFIILVLYFYTVEPEDNTLFLRALLLAVILVITKLIPVYMEDYVLIGWGISLVVSLYSIIKLTGQSIVSSVFFLIVLEIVSYVLQIGLVKYIH